ncbi:MAG: hypothetical protein ABR585_13420 [Gemmatimonadaceae bacterium]
MNTPPYESDFDILRKRENAARLEKVRTDIAGRLKKACSHLSEEEFDALVHAIARVQLRPH